MKWIVCTCLMATLVSHVGCSQPAGPKTMHVWGDVSLDGKPIEDGSITFESSDGSPPAEAAIKAGHYDLPAEIGPLVDKTYTVRINALAKTGKTIPNVMGDGAPTMDVMVEMIPSSFNLESNIKKTISSDPQKNQFNIKLKRPGSFE